MTIATVTNANIKPNPNPNSNPYTTVNQKPNDNPRSNFLSLEISSQEQLSPEQDVGSPDKRNANGISNEY